MIVKTKCLFLKDGVDPKELDKAIEYGKIAPLHNPCETTVIKVFKNLVPNAKNVGVFDTSFHTTIPAINSDYCLDRQTTSKYEIKKYGFHGTSYRYITLKMEEILGKKNPNLVICHIGNGASICAVKEGKSRGLMTSFNRIGTEWTGGSYRLVTKILRKEWGFVGTVICDFNTNDKAFMDSKQMLYAGGDINLAGDKQCMLQKTNKYGTPFVSEKDAKDASLLRRSAHNNLYAIVNSCAMKVDVVGYNPPIWRVALNAAEIGIGAGVVVWGFLAIFTALRKKDAVSANA